MSETTYRIGEAAALLNLKTYVLRFWEVEFPQIEPVRTEKGQRLYSEKDLDVLRRIRFLLHERGLTIEGARRILTEEAARKLSGKKVGLRDKAVSSGSADAQPSLPPSGAAAGAEHMPAHEKALLQMLAMPAPEPAPAATIPALSSEFAREMAEELRAIRKLLAAGP